jgi:hypothetical protein
MACQSAVTGREVLWDVLQQRYSQLQPHHTPKVRALKPLAARQDHVILLSCTHTHLPFLC